MTDKEIVNYVKNAEEIKVDGITFVPSELYEGHKSALMLKSVANEVEWVKKNYYEKMHNLPEAVQHEGFKEYILDKKASFIVVD